MDTNDYPPTITKCMAPRVFLEDLARFLPFSWSPRRRRLQTQIARHISHI